MIKKENDYIYYKEGYKVKYVSSKVYNIVFTKEYNNEILKMNYKNNEIVIDTIDVNGKFIDYNCTRSCR